MIMEECCENKEMQKRQTNFTNLLTRFGEATVVLVALGLESSILNLLLRRLVSLDLLRASWHFTNILASMPTWISIISTCVIVTTTIVIIVSVCSLGERLIAILLVRDPTGVLMLRIALQNYSLIRYPLASVIELRVGGVKCGTLTCRHGVLSMRLDCLTVHTAFKVPKLRQPLL